MASTQDIAVAALCCYLYGASLDALLGLDDLGRGVFRYILDVPELDFQEILKEFSAGTLVLGDARAYCNLHKAITFRQREMYRNGEMTYRSPKWVAGAGD
jgi:hypothetical protein